MAESSRHLFLAVAVAALVLALLASPPPAEPQPQGRTARVGVLAATSAAESYAAFRDALLNLSWIESGVASAVHL